ncbi:hypothetical protein M2T79_09235 [Elizabethkingia miricola]|uniref:hypothetical protein n=1 Tax=Elizabethkingia miricola TaxID=172045 RepID=UPI0020185ED9|nr:hypothetical protein [Elizabethkingia miricola]MCL1656781.1 hypothetical protein [Elizabethkingia miricola]
MKTNKYTYLKVIQQNYGHGWEDCSEYITDSIGLPVERVLVPFPSKKWHYSNTLLNQDLKEYKLLGYPTRVIRRRIVNAKPSLRQNFKDCDDFANYVFDSVLDYGSIISNEFNQLTGLDIKVGSDINTIESFPFLGINYIEFGSVKSMLYDLYYFLIKENKINTLN